MESVEVDEMKTINKQHAEKLLELLPDCVESLSMDENSSLLMAELKNGSEIAFIYSKSEGAPFTVDRKWVPKEEDEIYFPVFDIKNLVGCFFYKSNISKEINMLFKNGVAFKTPEEARACAKWMIDSWKKFKEEGK